MNHFQFFFVFFFASVLSSGTNAQDAVSPLKRAHAHNDYYHKRPLLDALDQGFCSVEADVYLQKGKLMVAHTIFEVRKDRTLEKLYLEPLAQRIKKKGNVQAKDDGFTLLIDFKSDAAKSLVVLNQFLKPLEKDLTRMVDSKIVKGKITIVISGNRPTKQIVSAKNRLVFLDGRVGDPANWGNDISPLVSESWNSHFKYRGFGDMKPSDTKKLVDMVSRVHKQKKRMRFWALPDREKGWQTAYDAGVDLINTDKLEELNRFLSKQKK